MNNTSISNKCFIDADQASTTVPAAMSMVHPQPSPSVPVRSVLTPPCQHLIMNFWQHEDDQVV